MLNVKQVKWKYLTNYFLAQFFFFTQLLNLLLQLQMVITTSGTCSLPLKISVSPTNTRQKTFLCKALKIRMVLQNILLFNAKDCEKNKTKRVVFQ